MIYLDCASTTQPYKQALERFIEVSDKKWMNPSSKIYSSESSEVINQSRQQIADIVGVAPAHIIFTSGSTEAANWIIGQYGSGDHIITNMLEHPCVFNAVVHSKANYHFAKNDCTGMIDIESVMSLLDWTSKKGGRTLVVIMGANNEIGTINPIVELSEIVSSYPNTAFFSDTTQLWPHERIDAASIDFACMSAHKFGGLKGTGFVYAKNPTSLKPLLYGGHQESGLRAGTENIGGIAAMAEALRITESYKDSFKDAAVKIREQILSRSEYRFNGSSTCIQNIVSMTLPDCNAQEMVAALAMDGIYLSAGSACNTGSTVPSRVLTNIGLTNEEASRTLRISFDAKVRDSDIDYLFDRILYYRGVLKNR